MADERRMSKLEYGVASDPGTRGQPMEDASSFFVAPASDALGGQVSVAVIADGIGGPTGGAEASRIAVDSVQQYFTLILTTNVPKAIAGAMEAAHNAIRRAQSTAPERAGMKSTLTIAVIADDRLYVGSIGDSRLYLMREGEIRPLTNDRTWVQQALESGSKKKPRSSVKSSGPPSAQYLGVSGPIKPLLRPVEFLWPGDTILLCTDGLSDFVPERDMRDILASGPTTAAGGRLIQTALSHGAADNITAMVLSIPGQAPAMVVPLAAPARRSRFSRTAKVLILGNLLLLCMIELLIGRSTGLIRFLGSPEPTVQVAKPVFITPTPGLDLPSSALEQTPTTGTVTPTAPALAAAPTLAPQPQPTFTPNPVPPGWTPPPPPILRSPANGYVFGGSDANVILSWDSVGNLPDDVFYVLVIRKYGGSTLLGESHNWTKATRLKLDSSFYTAVNQNSPVTSNVSSGSNGQTSPSGQLDTATVQFQWSVVLERLTLINPDGSLAGTPISSPSRDLMFYWGPTAPATPTLAPPPPSPTPIYGSDALNNDPFFMAQRQRQDTSNNLIFPLSAGMTGFSVLVGAFGAWPVLRSKRRRSRSKWPLRKHGRTREE